MRNGRKIYTQVPDELWRELEASAASNMTTPSEIVRRALRQAFKKRGKSQPHRDREVAHAA